MEQTFRAVLIHTPSSQPDRFFCEKDCNVRLWPETNLQGPQDVVFMLTANGITASPVKVVLKTIENE